MSIRILIADDHAVIRRLLRTLLETRPEWRVCGEAENGREAVTKAAELKPDLIVLDLMMPIMNGLQAAREISTADPAVPILMFTNHTSSELELEAKKAGIRQVVSKGNSDGQLLRAIATALLNKKPQGTKAPIGREFAERDEPLSPTHHVPASPGDSPVGSDPFGIGNRKMRRKHNPYLLDVGVPEKLREFFPRETVLTSLEGGLSARASDNEVILLAHERHSLLVTADEGLLKQCKSYQLRWRICLYGLLILPQGIQLQERILEDIELEKKKLTHPQIGGLVAWSDVREENLAVITRPKGDPKVLDLCDCSWPAS